MKKAAAGAEVDLAAVADDLIEATMAVIKIVVVSKTTTTLATTKVKEVVDFSLVLTTTVTIIIIEETMRCLYQEVEELTEKMTT